MASHDPDDDDLIDDMLWRLERVDAEHHTQYRRLLNVEGHMDLLIRRNDPAVFGAWLRDYDFAAKREKPVRWLIDVDLPKYIGWLQRLREAYLQTPTRDLFEEGLEGADT